MKNSDNQTHSTTEELKIAIQEYNTNADINESAGSGGKSEINARNNVQHHQF